MVQSNSAGGMVSGERSSRGPLTFGQKSVNHLFRGRPGNVAEIVRLPAAVSIADVRSALHDLAQRHEALRTTFAFSSSAGAEQQIIVARIDPLVEELRLEADDSGVLNDVAANYVQQAFDVERTAGWRAVVVVVQGWATAVVLVASHLIVDCWGLRTLRGELIDIVSGRERQLPGVVSPHDLATRQQGADWDGHRALSAGHWECFAADPRRMPAAGQGARPGPRNVATMQLQHPRTEIEALAGEIGVFPSGLWLALAMASWRVVQPGDLCAATVVNTGRVDPVVERVVSTHTQNVPVAVEAGPDVPFAEFAADVQEVAVDAACASSYDVDAPRERLGLGNLGDALDFHINVMESGPEDFTDAPTGSRDVTWRRHDLRAWPNFHYRIRLGDQVHVSHAVADGPMDRVLTEHLLLGWDRAVELIAGSPDVPMSVLLSSWSPTG